jgi:hypothetical protein
MAPGNKTIGGISGTNGKAIGAAGNAIIGNIGLACAARWAFRCKRRNLVAFWARVRRGAAGSDIARLAFGGAAMDEPEDELVTDGARVPPDDLNPGRAGRAAASAALRGVTLPRLGGRPRCTGALPARLAHKNQKKQKKRLSFYKIENLGRASATPKRKTKFLGIGGDRKAISQKKESKQKYFRYVR